MKHLFAILKSLFVIFIWILPAFMMYHGGSREWSILYLPVLIITILIGNELYEKY